MNVIYVKDLSVGELDFYTKYTEVQLKRINEPDVGIFIAESENVIRRALVAGYEPISLFVEERKLEAAEELLLGIKDIPIYVAEYALMREMLGYELTGGMLCAMRRRKPLDVLRLISNALRIAVLCDVENPTNVGAIFRNAAGGNPRRSSARPPGSSHCGGVPFQRDLCPLSLHTCCPRRSNRKRSPVGLSRPRPLNRGSWTRCGFHLP